MSSSLFFPGKLELQAKDGFFPLSHLSDNHRRYDRMQQLLNDVTSTKAFAFQQIETQKDISARLDKICKDLMAKSGFKNLNELHDSVAKTLPEGQRNRYLKSINTLIGFDNIMGNASMIIGTIGASAGSIGLGIDRSESPNIPSSQVLLLSYTHQNIKKCDLSRWRTVLRRKERGIEAFSTFWHGNPYDGWREMSATRKLMQQHLKEGMVIAGEDINKSMRLWKTLQRWGEVMDFIAKWAFIIEVVILWMQFNVEAEQRAEMRKAITSLFYYRFSIVEQLKNIQATVNLYSSFSGYLESKKTLVESGVDQKTQDTVLTKMAETMVEERRPDLEKITDAAIWPSCDDFDLRSTTGSVYKDDDPPKDEAREWLETEQKKHEQEEKNFTEEQRAQKYADSMKRAKDNSPKSGLGG